MRKLVTYFIECCVTDPEDEMSWCISHPTKITDKWKWSDYQEACNVIKACRIICKEMGEKVYYRLVKSVEVRKVLKV